MEFVYGIDQKAFQVAVHDALSSWGELMNSEEELLGFLLLVRERRAALGTNQSPLKLRRATNNVLQDAIDLLAQQEETEATVLRYRFEEGQITRLVANRVSASTDQVNRWQRSAITNLTQILISQEMALRQQRRAYLEAALPASPYSRLFGFQSLQKEVTDQLLRADGAWVVAIVGIGGIGKTCLADSAIRDTIDSLVFDKLLWSRVSARRMSGTVLDPEQSFERLLNNLAQQLWPDRPMASSVEIRQRLRQQLKARPHLVVIDNLESEEMTMLILEQVRELSDPSKFLITSRARPTVSMPAYFISVEELALADAAQLLRFHAEAIGLSELANAKDDVIESIYDLTGGNPLALKLVTSLSSVLPLSKVLLDLAESQPGPIENLYRFIYWESWRMLSQQAQALLQAMPLVADSGALPEQMISISALDELVFWPAVTELITRSLLEVRGTVHERRYGVHRLTESFLRTEIIHWPDE